MRSSSTGASSVSTADFEDSYISDDCRALAVRLSGHMGLEHAMQISNENQWHGVVAALREMQQKKKRIC
ncbi:hypothetical protein [Kordiimonas aestuarii]|uniref:hypothetical protein n=1 Tax=Kordiimonas aestuarii TaxID=1005925 RepID=UPI0021D2D0E6|nr:hypothetical protein [Kordiimonas aestuarii]